MGGGAYNEALIASLPTFEAGGGGTSWTQSSIPGQGGPMWYGPAFDAYGAHRRGETGDHYTQFADVAGRTTAYSSADSNGTPYVGDENYDVLGADGTRRGFDPDTGVGAYSTGAHPSGLAGSYRLEYSGDGSSDSGTPGSEDAMRPTSYRMINGSELFDIWLDGEVYYYHGYLSLDVERDRIWSWFDPIYRTWLRSGEAYEGVAPGYCPGGGCNDTAVPMDWGRLEHQGPVRWYGAMVIGGTGGCTLAVDGGTDIDGKPPQASVMEQNQRIVCLLPLNAVPDGRCPGETLR